MVHHGFCPPIFICANIIPIPKGSKANSSDSDKYRSIAFSSLLGKILDINPETYNPYYYSQTI